jgi:hypothetical protein
VNTVRLDFGCGQHCRKNFEGVDVCNLKSIKHRVDLLKFPLPWSDSSVDEIWCSHYIEHIPAREVTNSDLLLDFDDANMLGQDMFFAFFDECWRILKPNSNITLIWPALQTNRAFKDPTHRRFIPLETLPYLNAGWRKANSLDHYHVRCNFEKIPRGEQSPKSWTDKINYRVTLRTLKT